MSACRHSRNRGWARVCAFAAAARIACADFPECVKFAQEERNEEALRCLQAFLLLHPGDLPAQKLLAAIDLRIGREAEAAQRLEDLLAKDPADHLVRNNLAWLLATAKDPALCRPQRAVDLAREALLVDPDDHHIWSTLAEGYYGVGEFEKALKAVETALRLGEDRKASPTDMQVYREQRDRLQGVAAAMSLVE